MVAEAKTSGASQNDACPKAAVRAHDCITKERFDRCAEDCLDESVDVLAALLDHHGTVRGQEGVLSSHMGCLWFVAAVDRAP
jgi:hypothetical protein